MVGAGDSRVKRLRRPRRSGRPTGWPWPRSISAGSSSAQIVLRLPAAGAEPAARRRVHGRRHVAGEHDPPALALELRVRHRHRRQQGLRVRMGRAVVDVVARRRSRRSCRGTSPPPGRRCGAPPTGRGRRTGRRGPSRAWSSSSRLTTPACTDTSSADTGSSSTITFGSSAEGPGDADALALAAGELVRVAVAVLRVEADEPEQLGHPVRAALAVEVVDLERLGDDVVDRQARVQRRVRVLEHDLQVPAHRAHLPGRQRRQLLALEHHRARRGLVELEHGARRSWTSRSRTRRRGRASRPGAGRTTTPDTAWTSPTTRRKTPPPRIGKCLTRSVTCEDRRRAGRWQARGRRRRRGRRRGHAVTERRRLAVGSAIEATDRADTEASTASLTAELPVRTATCGPRGARGRRRGGRRRGARTCRPARGRVRAGGSPPARAGSAARTGSRAAG